MLDFISTPLIISTFEFYINYRLLNDKYSCIYDCSDINVKRKLINMSLIHGPRISNSSHVTESTLTCEGPTRLHDCTVRYKAHKLKTYLSLSFSLFFFFRNR